MNDEMKEIELELARIQLAQERLALQDKIVRRNRNNSINQSVFNIGNASRELTLRSWVTAKVFTFTIVIWITFLAIGVFLEGKPTSFSDWQYKFGFALVYAGIPIFLIALYYGIKQWRIWPKRIMGNDKRPLLTRMSENIVKSFSGSWLFLARIILFFVIIVGGLILFTGHRADPSDTWAIPFAWAIWIGSIIGMLLTFKKK